MLREAMVNILFSVKNRFSLALSQADERTVFFPRPAVD